MSSTVANSGLRKPNETTLDPARATVVKLWTVAAVPPPAMMASVHFKCGVMSPKTDAMRTVPATVATGPASASSELSTHGT